MAGLLDGLTALGQDPGTLGMAQGLLASSGWSPVPVSTGAALAQGMGGMNNYRLQALQRQMMQGQVANLPLQQQLLKGQVAGQNLSLAQQKAMLNYRRALAGQPPLTDEQMMGGDIGTTPASPTATPQYQNAAAFEAGAGAPAPSPSRMQAVAGQMPQAAPQGAPVGTGGVMDPDALFNIGMQGYVAGDPNGMKLMETAATLSPKLQGALEKAKAEAGAPSRIAESLVSRAGTPIALHPGENYTTGFEALPADMQGIIRGALSGGQPQAGMARPGAPMVAQGAAQSVSGLPTQTTRGPSGTLQSPFTVEGLKTQENAAEKYKKAGDDYLSAQNLTGHLDMMDKAIDALGPNGFAAMGTGANTRLGALKALNSTFAALGAAPPFDPAKVASWESFNKESTRAGFELAKTLGSREAQMIVQQAVSAVPNAEQSYLGAKLVSSSLRQAAQRQQDFYEFLTSYAKDHGGSTFGADVVFNKAHPVKSYVDQAVKSAYATQTKMPPGAASTAVGPDGHTIYAFKKPGTANDYYWADETGREVK